MASTPTPDLQPDHGEHDPDQTGVTPTEADPVAHPEQPPLDDDASGLPDQPAEDLGDFA